jgi:probable blue pigment (indigoidine) exporter
VVLTKKWGRPVGLLAFTSWQLIAGGVFLAPLVLVVEGVPTSLTPANLAGYTWLASVGGVVAYTLWFRGIQALPIAQVSILGLLSPVVAALGGWLVLAQTLNPVQFAGMAAILLAVWIAQTEPATNTHVSLIGSNGPPPHRKALTP